MQQKVAGQKSCASTDYYQLQLKKYPAIASTQLQIEKLIKSKQLTDKIYGSGSDGPNLKVINIPVVVHVVFNATIQNISDEQIRSQIEILNNDFRRLNADSVNTPGHFKSLASDCHFTFTLANVDPNGFATTGIIRKQTGRSGFAMDDAIKSSGSGGDNAWDSDKYLNIWVGNLSNSILGYSSPVGGPKETDGIVIKYTAFGTIGAVAAPYNKGRTAVHEIGHWLGLFHIWGDQVCGDDHIDDTPSQQAASRGCPNGIVLSCDNSPTGNMYMNYMDLTDDACTNMFTHGQRMRMRTLFDLSGPRFTLLASNGNAGNGIPPPVNIPIGAAVEPNVRISPNPAKDWILIDLGTESTLSGKQILIYNQFGQVVMTATINNEKMSINIGKLSQGIYLIKIADRKQSYKIIKGQ
jgi:hypothetical protein